MIRTSNTSVEQRHLGPETKYIALDDLNFAWIEEEILAVLAAWEAGRPLWEIADQVRRPQEEVMVLLMDLSRKGAVRKRRRGVFGEG